MATAGDGLRRLAQRAERFEDEWPREGAALVERAVTASLRSATGDGALSHAPRLGRATVTVRRLPGGASVEADGARGVWGILEKGTRAHVVRARDGGLLRTPYGARRQVRVSGVRARRTWSKGVESADGAVRASARAAVQRVVSG